MAPYLGDFPVNGKVFHLWNTFSGSGASITRATDGTLKVYKGNLTAATWITERSSLNGITQTEDFDGLTGVHGIAIDLSDNTDAGFYAAGNEYQLAYSAMGIDGQTVNAAVASFSIERAGGVLALLKAGSVVVASVTGAVASVTGAVTVAAGQIFIKKGAAFTFQFPMWDLATPGKLKTGLTVTTQIDKDGAGYAGTTNTAAEMAATGMYKLTLTAAETTATVITGKATAAGAADTPFELVTQP